MKEKEVLELVESIELLTECFKDKAKVAKWLATYNPNFAVAPMFLFSLGRGHKVLQFIKVMKEENSWNVESEVKKNESK